MLNSLLKYLFEELLSPVWTGLDFGFSHLPLSALAVVLGLGFCVPQVFGLKDPKAFASMTRRFSRSLVAGRVLVAVATLWFLYYLHGEDLSDFVSFKPYLMMLFLLVGVGTCVFVQDFLAVRGLAVVMLLLAKLMVDTGRPALGVTHWTLVIQGWAYVLVLAGMWFTVSPWRLRDFLEWGSANEQRIKIGCGIRLAFGLFVAGLGVAKF